MCFRCDLELNIEGAPFTGGAVYPDSTAMSVDDFPHQGEAEPGPADDAAIGIVDPVKIFKDLFTQFRRYPHPFVLYPHDDTLLFPICSYGYRTPCRRILDGVGNEIDQHLVQLPGISQNLGQVRSG